MSRYFHINRSRKPRKDSRTIPIPGHRDYGEGRDDGVWYKCWNCGFRCKVGRDELGGEADEAGTQPIAYTQVDQYGDTAYHCYGAAGADQATCEAAGGTWTATSYKPSVTGGCPLCGTKNWRGDF